MSACTSLGSQCGTNIDHDHLNFSAAKSNLVYMDKVYSYNKGESCPLLLSLNTRPRDYTVTLRVTDPSGCCCNNCGVDCSSTFTVTGATVLVEQLLLNGSINPSQVTVNGIPVDSISSENGQYVASTANLISRIQNCRCMENGLPTKTFFLASNIGPWAIRFRIILEGVVSTGGKNCCFRAEFVNRNTSFAALPTASTSDFAIPKLSLPCSINHVAPVIRFQFGAVAQLLNPVLTLADSKGDECDAVTSNLVLNGTLVINPTIAVEVIRKSLFCVTACEAMIPCDGTLESLLASEEDDEDDCDPFADDCACGTARPRPISNAGSNSSCDCGNNSCGCGNNSCGCGNNAIGGVSSGNCGCNNNSCGCGGSSCGCGNNAVGGVSTGSCGCNSNCGSNSVLNLTGTHTCNSCTNL